MIYKAVIFATAAHAPQLRAARGPPPFQQAPAPVWVAGLFCQAAGTPSPPRRPIAGTRTDRVETAVVDAAEQGLHAGVDGVVRPHGPRDTGRNNNAVWLAVGLHCQPGVGAAVLRAQEPLAAALQFGLWGFASLWSAFKKDARLPIPYAAALLRDGAQPRDLPAEPGGRPDRRGPDPTAAALAG